MPHAAAGPLVTPTKPIFSVSFAAEAPFNPKVAKDAVAIAAATMDFKNPRLMLQLPDFCRRATGHLSEQKIKRLSTIFVKDIDNMRLDC